VKVLLDECIDARLAAQILGFETRSVHDQGWIGISNGKLLALAAAEFDVFVTVDRNLSFQQHLPKFEIAVVLLHCHSNRLADLILLHCHSNRLADLMMLVPALLSAIPKAKMGVVMHVGRDRTWSNSDTNPQ
jgi:Domain of unknown function (DUF5615)